MRTEQEIRKEIARLHMTWDPWPAFHQTDYRLEEAIRILNWVLGDDYRAGPIERRTVVERSRNVVSTPNTVTVEVIASETKRRLIERLRMVVADLDEFIRVNGGSGYSPSYDRVPCARQRLLDALSLLGEEGANETTRSVQGCSACGQDHPIRFCELPHPIDGATHGGVCPNTGRAVLMREEPE